MELAHNIPSSHDIFLEKEPTVIVIETNLPSAAATYLAAETQKNFPVAKTILKKKSIEEIINND